MDFYNIKVYDRNEEEVLLKKYKGKVLLIVNTATGCGFTPQYKALEDLYERYNEKGFEILDFPCDQFGHQAPGSNEEINDFCTLKYNTTFDRFAKVDVNGKKASQLFKYLKRAIPNEEIVGIKNKITMKAIEKISTSVESEKDIKWNFTKFLVDKEGNVVKRYDPTFDPKQIEKDIIELL